MQESTLHILIVDDDKDYVDFVRHQLRPFQNRRFELIWVNNGEKALQELKTNPAIDLVLMDYFLPNTNGVEITKKIYHKQISKPIILLTSNKDFRIAIEAMKYGVEDYLIKEETVDTILPRSIINAVDRIQLSKKISETEKEKLILQKKMEAIQELVVTMCHEFNNPLAAIKISTDILMRQSVSEDQKTMLTEFNNNITHLEKQIVKLRDLDMGKYAAP